MAPPILLVAVDTNFLLDLLITSDEHLRSADPALLGAALKACDVQAILVRTPREIVRQFG